MKEYKNSAWLYHKYVEEGLSSYDIAKLQTCTSTTIRSWLRKHNIKIRDAGYYTKLNIPESILRNLYIDQYKTIAEVAFILSTNSNTIIKYLRAYSIESRTVFDYPSFLEGHKKTKEKITGRPRSLQTRLKISQTKTTGEWKGFANKHSVYTQYCTKPEYKIWRQSIFERDAFTCQECGARGCYLELHHITPLRDHREGIMEDCNAITLCRKCHGVTKNREYEFKDKFTILAGNA